MDDNTTGGIFAFTINNLTGAAADLNTAYDSEGISGLGNEDVTLSDASLAAGTLNTLDSNTTGTVNADTVDTLSGAAADLNTAYDSDGISNLGDEDITLSDASLAANTLNTLDSNTTGTVNADTVNTLSGAAADLNTAYDSDGISNLGDEDITLSDASLAADALNTLDSNTTGTVNADTVNTLSGAAADLNTAYDSDGISNLGDEDITLSDASLAADALNTLDSNTTGTVNADTVDTLSGTAADLNTAYDSDGISNLGDEDITLTDAITRSKHPQHARQQHHRHRQRRTPSTLSLVPQQISTPPTTPTASAISVMKTSPSLMHHSCSKHLNTLDSNNTTGTVNADTVNTLSGAAADLNTAYDSDGISNLGDEDITLSDASLAASVLNTLDSNTTGTVNARHRQHSLWCRSRSQHRLRLSGISNLGDEDITLSDASLAADTLNTLDSNTTGTVNADTVNTSPVPQQISTPPTLCWHQQSR